MASSGRELRKVLLTPEHSQWWLISPGVSLYYDQVVMLRDDYDKAIAAGDQSSYHEEVALRLEAIVQRGEAPIIEVVQKYEPSERDYAQLAQSTLTQLMDIAGDEADDSLTTPELIRLARDAFAHWINYNARKVDYLREGEPLQTLLVQNQLPSWRDRLLEIDRILAAPDEAMLELFSNSSSSQSTLLRLLASSWRCIDLVSAGYHIYDPMLEQYLPAISLLERLRTSEEFFTRGGGDINVLFDAYNLRMQRYQERVPIQLEESKLLNVIREFGPIRQNLERVDRALRTVDAKDPSQAFEEARKEIAPLVAAAARVEVATEYAFWAAGIFASLVGILGIPTITKKAAESAAALELVRRDVGRFAGAYSLIVDELLAAERVSRSAGPRRFSQGYFAKHYWDFGMKIGFRTDKE